MAINEGTGKGGTTAFAEMIIYSPYPLHFPKISFTFTFKYVNTFLPKRETVTDRRRHMDT
jgi:hypothetical protein